MDHVSDRALLASAFMLAGFLGLAIDWLADLAQKAL